jgi:hypothetical protein
MLLGGFWPQTTSITLDVKNNYAHTTQRILNKLIERKISEGCMVWHDAVYFNQSLY